MMKPIKTILSLVLLIGAVILLVSCNTSDISDETYMTVDINPSMEFIVTKSEKVVYVNALNEDAEVLLTDLQIEGKDLDVVMNIIIDAAINLGYIDVDSEATYVSVLTISNDQEAQERIKTRAKEHINQSFQDHLVMGRAQDKSFTPEFLVEAESYGVTPGFLLLAKSAVTVNDDLLLEDALLLEVKELQAMIKEARMEMKSVAHGLRAEFFAARDAIRDEYLPLIQALEVESEVKVTLKAEQELLLETATEEEKSAILETIATLDLEISALEDELVTLQSELHLEISTLRDSFHQASLELRAQIREMFNFRQNSFKDHVENFLQNRNRNKDQYRDEIENWQNQNQE